MKKVNGEIEESITRSYTGIFERTKLLLTAAVLMICGFITVFCTGIAYKAAIWPALSLLFLSFFLSAALVMGLGIVLIRSYHDTVKKRALSYGAVVKKSWTTILSAMSLFIPIIALYLLQWVLLGIFIFFKEMPILGEVFAVILVFGPFLLNLGSIFLCLFSLCVLFVATPIMALKRIPKQQMIQYILLQTKDRICARIVLFVLALAPLICMSCLLWLAAFLTTASYSDLNSHLQLVLQWFFMMVPFVIFLTPPVIFFFNMAAETHVLLRVRD